jgi:predicted porin
MNKNLISLAVAAALAAPLAVNAAPTVYGAAHLSVDSLDNGNAADNKLTTLSSNSSYIGFKGDEDLGNGLKAIYGFEWQIGLDNASSGLTSTTSNRNAFAGFSGGFGTFRAGNYDDVVKQVGRKVDFFWNEQLGESRAITRGTDAAPSAATAYWDERLANSLNYESAKIGGSTTVTVNYGMANNTNTSTALQLTATAIGVQYEAGALYVGLGYKTVDVNGGTVVNTTKATRLTAAYTMGNFKVAGFYQAVKDEAGATGADRTVTGLGASFVMGQGTVKAQMYKAGDNKTANTGATLTAIGYDYKMSNTTSVYVAYASVDNDSAAAYSVVGAGHANPSETGYAATGDGKDPSGLSVGMKVSF